MFHRILRAIACALLFCALAPAGARELRIVFYQYTPPYVLENGSGILVDITREALAGAGHRVTPVYAPMGRGAQLFADGQVDGITIVQEASRLKGHYSADFVQYQNRAFVVKGIGPSALGSVDDLKGHSVAAFQNASKFLGPAFGQMAAANRQYREIAQQDAQVQMLLVGRVEVAVLDDSIFRYYRERLLEKRKVERAQEIVAFAIFPPTPYKAAFIDPTVRDDFDRGVAAMKRDGRYEAVYRRYLAQSPEVRR
ncbi:MAG TPA: transporter substrate-binding domain-containing protein [Ramlibacter sp.]|nr:transporter substrate-binding domain-containing protein [Ramlibacter sp.]